MESVFGDFMSQQMSRADKQLHDLRVSHEVFRDALYEISGRDPEGNECGPDCNCIGCVARHALEKGRVL